MTDVPQRQARRRLASNRFFDLVEDELRTAPTAAPYSYYHLQTHNDAVLVVPLFADGSLLYERIYRHPYGAYLAEFPAGGIDHGEDPLAAAARELREETGYDAERLDALASIEPLPGLVRMRLHVVLARELRQVAEPEHEELELLTVHRASIDDLWQLADQEPASAFLTAGLAALARWQATTGA
ncbi:MAG: NUDIX hydrolase [Planctomycetota bacterium]|jgi:ADP-ribose pyrophosphatase